MKAVDPKIEIIVDGHDGSLRGVVPLALEQLAGRIDYFATHFYRPWEMTEVFRGEQKVTVEELSAEDIWYAWTAITEFDEQGRSVYDSSGLEMARRAGYRVAITEWNWNGQWRAKASPPLNSRWAKGVGAAGFVHAMMRSGDGAIHHMVQGRLNDAPKEGQPEQIGCKSTRKITGSAKPLKVTLPERSVSCVEIPLAR